MAHIVLELPVMRAWPFLLLVVTACSGGAEPEAAEASEGEAAYTAEDAACFDEAPATGESATDARARCLTGYATRLLDVQIGRGEDPRDRALAAYRGKVRVAGETGCFTEDVSGGGLGAWQYDIDSRRDVGMVGVQLRAAVELLKHAHRDLDGYPNHFFDTVEICPQGQVGRDLALVGSRLRIGVRTGYWGRYGFHTAPALRDMWTRGAHLEGNPALAPLAGVRWAMLDPIGTPRTTLRRALRGIVGRIRGALAEAPGRADAREEVARLIRDATPAGTTDERGRNVRERALAYIAELPADRLAAFAAAWSAEVERSDTAEGAEEATVSMNDVLNKRDVKVVVNQTGLVNVNNYKQVSVDTELFLPRAASFSRFVEVAESQTTIEVNQFGLVNVQLNDVHTIRVQVLFGRTLQTASLDRALGP